MSSLVFNGTLNSQPDSLVNFLSNLNAPIAFGHFQDLPKVIVLVSDLYTIKTYRSSLLYFSFCLVPLNSPYHIAISISFPNSIIKLVYL